MPTGLTQSTTTTNQTLAKLSREMYLDSRAAHHSDTHYDVMFPELLPLDGRRSEFSLEI
jgi:hypothetical protein